MKEQNEKDYKKAMEELIEELEVFLKENPEVLKRWKEQERKHPFCIFF